MTLSNQHAQHVMMQCQDASSAAAADTAAAAADTAAAAAATAATAATALAKLTPEMSLNTPVLFWGITKGNYPQLILERVGEQANLPQLDRRGPPTIRPVLPTWQSGSLMAEHTVHVRRPWRHRTDHKL
jgi:hypothetical protein